MPELIAHKQGGSYTLEQIEQEAHERVAKEAAAQAEAEAKARDQAGQAGEFARFKKSTDEE